MSMKLRLGVNVLVVGAVTDEMVRIAHAECKICNGKGYFSMCYGCLHNDVGCDDCTVACSCLRPTKQPSPELQRVLADALASISKAVAETRRTDGGDA